MPPSQAAGGGSILGQSDAPGCPVKKALKPSQRRRLVDDLRLRYGVSSRKACLVMKLSRSVYYYRSRRRDSTVLQMRIKEIARDRVHYGYQRIYVLLRREGFKDNHKRVYRLYREMGLSLHMHRPCRNKSAQRRQPQTTAVAINDVWSMDFVMDQLYDGRRLRALTVVDNYTRECLAIEIGQNLRGEDVVRTLDDICRTRDKPCSTTVANLFRRPLIAGPMSIASNWISVVRVNLPTMRNANRSMVGSDKSA